MKDQFWTDKNRLGKWMELQGFTESLPKTNVEECYTITAGSFGRNLLHPLGTSVSDGVGGALGKSGTAFAWKWKIRSVLEINFEVQLETDEPRMFIQFKPAKIAKSQEVLFNTIPTKFGNKPRLVCGCGHAGKLYLKPDGDRFQCFNCAHLAYGIKKLDRRWGFNALAYLLDRDDKLGFMFSRICRPKYNGQYTKKAFSLLRLAGKWNHKPLQIAQAWEEVTPVNRTNA